MEQINNNVNQLERFQIHNSFLEKLRGIWGINFTRIEVIQSKLELVFFERDVKLKDCKTIAPFIINNDLKYYNMIF